MKIDFFETVNKLKDCLKISDEELSNLLGVSLKTIKKWEDRTKQPRGDFKRKIINLCKKNNVMLVEYVPDFDYIKRICNLTCTENDLLKNEHFIKYDYDHPFDKYYNLNIIINAFNKYKDINDEYRLLENWSNIYGLILSNGCLSIAKQDYSVLKKNIVNSIYYLLNGVSSDCFITREYAEYNFDYKKTLLSFKNLNHVLETLEERNLIYLCQKDEDYIEEIFGILINNKRKECLIIYNYDEDLINGYEDKQIIKIASKEDYINTLNLYKENNYSFLHFDEECLKYVNEFKNIKLKINF